MRACRSFVLALGAVLLLAARSAAIAKAGSDAILGADPHSFSRPEEVVVHHLVLDLTVDFSSRQLQGRASLHLHNPRGARELVLDTSGLNVVGVQRDDVLPPTPFSLGDPVEYLGRPLRIPLEAETEVVHVDYTTSPDATALLWLEGPTAGGLPFLFTQSQSVYARTWIPCPDSPGVRFTYEATVRVPPGLLALMSAANPQQVQADGVYHFQMPQPVPAYLLALAVGELEFLPLGSRTGVYAQPDVVDAAAWEFAKTESMLTSAESLYGEYPWERFDILVLPPFFPLGGMENPRLTFITPTLLAGDRSLVTLIAHELAHSWSGNLVTNRTWNDLWLNEGFTVYIERRIMEKIESREYAEMLALLGRQDLVEDIERLGPDSDDTRLYVDFAGRDPEDSFTDVAYEKGYFLLRLLEENFGRRRWDAFLHGYFSRHAFEGIDTATFLRELKAQLFAERGDAWEKLGIETWVHGPGIPANCPTPQSSGFAQVEAELASWTSGADASELDVAGWTPHHWLHFLRGLPSTVDGARLGELDTAFHLSESPNAEILSEWLQRCVESWYEPAFASMSRFLTTMGRGKFLSPIYTRLAASEPGMRVARDIYQEARPNYHPLAVQTIDEILHWKPPVR